ncbi:MAG: GGDEF domain-containing protein [Desulfosalsimonas sp.]
MSFKKYKINRRVLEDLEHRSTPGMYFYLVITALVLSVNGFYQRHFGFSVVFASAMTLIAIFRITQFYLFQSLYSLSRKFNFCAFFASVYATSIIWGAGFAYFMTHPEETPSQLVMLTATSGLTAGGVVAFIPAWRVSVLYNVFMLVPAALLMFALEINPTLAFLILLYALYMPIIASRGNREYWDALENEHLLKVKSDEIEKLSRTDGLTGLYNRRYFEEIFAQQWKSAARNSTPISLIIGDIDFFKHINDTYGHTAGDLFLQRAAELLRSIMKRETDFIARYGGEEFVILALNTGGRETRRLAEKIRRGIEKMSPAHEGMVLSTTISLGAATCIPQKHEKKEEFLKRTDEALYTAKNAGRNRVVFHGEKGPPDLG